MPFFYGLSTQFYHLAVKSASLFNKKAKLMTSGRKNWRENLKEKVDTNSKYIWVHCASLGEFEQGRPLIEKLKKEYGDKYKVLLTFYSPSGYEIRKDYDKADLVCYLPFDTPNNAEDFIKLINPVCAIFVKYDIWYYYLQSLFKNKIPTYLISGIFREGQIFFKCYGKSYKKALGFFSEIFLQDEGSKVILNNSGISKTTVCGDTRIDRVIAVASEAYENSELSKFSDGKRTIVCGSTWPDDEKILSKFINNSDNRFRFIIVPHEINEQHLKYTESIIKLKKIRLSKIHDISPETRVIIVDSIGILSKIYRFGQIAYIGGGFGKGIHNTLEAAVYNIPVVFGTNYSKFKEARDLIGKTCAFSVGTSSELQSIINRLYENKKEYEYIHKTIKQYISSSFGASERIFQNLKFLDRIKGN